jgi:hypothetical protein
MYEEGKNAFDMLLTFIVTDFITTLLKGYTLFGRWIIMWEVIFKMSNYVILSLVLVALNILTIRLLFTLLTKKLDFI